MHIERNKKNLELQEELCERTELECLCHLTSRLTKLQQTRQFGVNIKLDKETSEQNGGSKNRPEYMWPDDMW